MKNRDKNPEELKRLAESGDAQAMLSYSEYIRETSSLKEAHELHTQAALAGNPKAMVEEGNFILYGWVEGSLENAFDYFTKAAELGERKAYSDLGACYLYGWGCNQDFDKAKECFKRASRIKYSKIFRRIDSEGFRKTINGTKKLEFIREFYN